MLECIYYANSLNKPVVLTYGFLVGLSKFDCKFEGENKLYPK